MMNRRNFLKNAGKTVALVPLAVGTIVEAREVQETVKKNIKIQSKPRSFPIDSMYPEFHMSLDDPEAIYIRKVLK